MRLTLFTKAFPFDSFFGGTGFLASRFGEGDGDGNGEGEGEADGVTAGLGLAATLAAASGPAMRDLTASVRPTRTTAARITAAI